MRIRNSEDIPIVEINEQMLENRPLPLGRQEFLDWSDRIIAGAMIPHDEEDADLELFNNSLRFALAIKLTHLGPTESHKPDAYFIHSLRKDAINQVALSMMNEIKTARDEKTRLLDEALAAENEQKGKETLERAESLRLM
jgi:hypothetical protein